MTFFKSFPDSRLQLNDNFKNEISNTVSEWIHGVKAVPESYNDWKISVDLSISSKSNEPKAASTNECKHKHYINVFFVASRLCFNQILVIMKIGNLEKMLKNLGNEDSSDALKASKKSLSFKKKSLPRARSSEKPEEIVSALYDKKSKEVKYKFSTSFIKSILIQ